MRIANFTRAWHALPLLVGFCATLLLPQAGQAQGSQVASASEGLEEVVITAERRSEDLQKAAAAVSVRNGEDLASEGKYSLRSILEDVPGIQGGEAANTSTATGSGTDNTASGLIIRGIQSNTGAGGSNISVASAAAIYVDGVYGGLGGAYDINRVEALRGPQGTLYGRSATAGLVAIHTQDPKLGEFSGNVGVEVGNYGRRHYTGAVNIPLGETLALRVAGNRNQRDGYDSEQGSSGTFFSAQSGDTTDGRVKLLFQPSDKFSLLLGAAAQKTNSYSGGTTIRLIAPDSVFTIVDNPAGISPGWNKSQQFWAEAKWDLGFGQLTYLPAYRTWEMETDVHIRSPITSPLGSFDQISLIPQDRFWTHELHLASNPDSKLIWQVGAFYYDNTVHGTSTFNSQPTDILTRAEDITRDTTAWSGFAEGTYPFADDWRVTAGLRYDTTKVQVVETFINNNACVDNPSLTVLYSLTYCRPPDFKSSVLSGDAGKRTFNKASYKLRLEHDFTPSSLGYAMVSTGVTPGDVALTVDRRGTRTSNPNFGTPIPNEIKSETLTAYEIGSKNRFLDNTLQLNAAAYYYDYAGFQKGDANLNAVKDPVTGRLTITPSPGFYAVLTAPVKSYGLELESIYAFTPDDRVSLNYAYTKAHYSDKSGGLPGSNIIFADLNYFDDIPGVPPHTATLSYDHTFHVFKGSKLTVGADELWRSPYNEGQALATQPSDPNWDLIYSFVHTKNETFTNFNINWISAGGMYTVTAWDRNAFGNRYKTNVTITSVATLANGTISGITSIGPAISEPQTYGVNVYVRW